MVLSGPGLNPADFGASLKKLRGANICIMQELSIVFWLDNSLCLTRLPAGRDMHSGLCSAGLQWREMLKCDVSCLVRPYWPNAFGNNVSKPSLAAASNLFAGSLVSMPPFSSLFIWKPHWFSFFFLHFWDCYLLSALPKGRLSVVNTPGQYSRLDSISSSSDSATTAWTELVLSLLPPCLQRSICSRRAAQERVLQQQGVPRALTRLPFSWHCF